MKCTWVEGQLSEYLDEALDPQTRSQVQDHLGQCATCKDILEEYRRFDRLLANEPLIEPPAELRARIFESDEFAALMRELDQESPSSTENTLATARLRKNSGLSPVWTRALLPVAAALTLTLGGALVAKETILAPSSPSGAQQPATYGAPTGVRPLAAGSRVVYEHGGRLWSAPASGPGLAQPLTPTNVTVGAWSVSPLGGSSGGKVVAYLDARTGSLHVIRADDQNDTRIGSATPTHPAAALWSSAAGHALSQGGIAWSPDGSRIAYLAVNAAGGTTAHLINADGTNDRALNASSAAITSRLVWSADSLHLAYTVGNGQSVALRAYDLVTEKTATVATAADPQAPGATFGTIAWLPSTLTPGVTWTAQSSSGGTSVFSRVLAGGDTIRLGGTDAIAAADYVASGADGAWVLASGSGVRVVSAATGAVTASATASDTVQRVAWSPDGQTVAFVAGSSLSIWHLGSDPVAVASNVSATITPVWSADGSQLAYLAGNTVVSARLAGGSVQQVTVLATNTTATAMAWAPDSHTLAISTAHGTVVVSTEGTGARSVDTASPDDGILAWSVAG